MVLGSDANTVKILRLSPKRPLCAMQSKLSHRRLIRLPRKMEFGGWDGAGFCMEEGGFLLGLRCVPAGSPEENAATPTRQML